VLGCDRMACGCVPRAELAQVRLLYARVGKVGGEV
jgi:hypothetical protein